MAKTKKIAGLSYFIRLVINLILKKQSKISWSMEYKKNLKLLFIASIIIHGCSKEIIEFDGSIIQNDKEFRVDFTELNTVISHEMQLDSLDIIDVIISKNKGDIYISVRDDTGKNVYTGNKLDDANLSFLIRESCLYYFKVEGWKANGCVSFQVR
jgi:hypothetical protein